MNRRLRIGFVGAGFMGQKAHLDSFITIPDCEVVALAEGRAETAQRVARRYGIPAVYPDHRAMLHGEDLDAVVAIMPYALHASVIPEILQAGLHVLTEKPMCVGPDTAREMAALAERMGVVHYVGYMKRSAPAAQAALRTLDRWRETGEAGKMTYLRACMPPGDWVFAIEDPLNAGDSPPAYSGQKPEPFPAWMDEQTGRRYNTFINYYIHQVNLIRALLGEDYRVTWADPTGAVMGGMSEGGVPVVLEMAGYGLKNDWEESYRVVFEQGKVELDLPAPMARQRGGEVSIFRGGETQSTERPVVPPLWAFAEQARHFARCVQGLEEPRVSPWDGVKDLQVAEEYARLMG